MATPIRLHLDQHVPRALAQALRQYGVDVTTTNEAGLQDALDEEHLEYCLANSRVLVTHDADFLSRAAAGENHAGIISAPQQKYQNRVGELVGAVHLIYLCVSAEEMVDHVEFV